MKLLLTMIDMNLGGTEKALLGLLDQLLAQNIDVTVLLLEKRGDLLHELPKNVKVIVLSEYKDYKYILNEHPLTVLKKMLGEKSIFNGMNFLLGYMLSKVCGHRAYLFNSITKKITPKIETYDLAIAYAGPMDFITYYVLKSVVARKKAQWLHFDLSEIYINEIFLKTFYPKFDYLFCVSDLVKKQLRSIVGTDNNIITIPNSIPVGKVKTMSSQKIDFDGSYQGIKILTVGRLCFEKGQDFAIAVLKKLLNDGYDVKWYCIGDGGAKSQYEKLIDDNELQGKFILLGNKLNPYAYMKQCDIYVQPSRHEGYCISIDEALILKAPVVVANFLGIDKRVKNKETGLIVNADTAGLYSGVKTLLDRPELRNKFSQNLTDFENTIKGTTLNSIIQNS